MGIKNRTIFCEDNYFILKGMDNNTIDLIYLDPPFNSKREYTAPTGSKAEGAGFSDIFKEVDVKNSWVTILEKEHKKLSIYLTAVKQTSSKSNYCYLVYMSIRLIEIHRILKETGSIYLHCDPTMSHYLKQVLDIIFGENNFRNEIIWGYRTGGVSKKYFPRKHDTILYFSKNKNKTTHNPLKEVIKYDSPFFLKENIKPDADGKYSVEVFFRDIWDDNAVKPVLNLSKERIGYPTQKPLALLNRIIKASSNEGDIVLDPFCGCATTCVSAELLGRQWIGIDVSSEAYRLVGNRLEQEVERKNTLLEDASKKAILREDIPIRKDLLKDNRSKSEIKKYLYGEQDGDCNLCNTHFDSKDHFHLDHITPKSKGGVDNIQNYQLLCGRCNILKKDKTMAEAMEIARKKGIIKEIRY